MVPPDAQAISVEYRIIARGVNGLRIYKRVVQEFPTAHPELLRAIIPNLSPKFQVLSGRMAPLYHATGSADRCPIDGGNEVWRQSPQSKQYPDWIPCWRVNPGNRLSHMTYGPYMQFDVSRSASASFESHMRRCIVAVAACDAASGAGAAPPASSQHVAKRCFVSGLVGVALL